MKMPTEAGKMADVVLDALSEFVMYVDPQMRIRWANRVAVESAGQDLDSLRDRRCFEVWHQRDEPCPDCPVVKALETGQPQEGEVTSPEKKRWFIRATPILDERGNTTGVAEIAIDITERNRLQEELQKNEEIYRTLVETSPDAIALLDMQGNIIKANRQAALLVGLDEKNGLAGRNSLEFDAQNESGSFADNVKKLLQLDGHEIIEYEVLKSNGTKITTETRSAVVSDPAGKPRAITVVTRNVTDRIHAEKALRESEAKYAALVENAQDAIVILQDGECKFINQAAQKIYGYTIEELQSRPFLELVAPEFRESTVERYQSFFTGKDEAPRLHHAQIIHKDGTRRDVESTGAIIEYQDKPAVLGIFRDVTERKRVQETLQIEKDKMQALLDGLARVGIGIDIIGVDYKIHFQNETLKKARGDLTGKLCYEAYMESNTPCARCPMIDAVRNNKPESIEVTGIDGKDFEILSAPLPNPDGSVDKAIEIVLDITARKRTEKELRESEERYRSVIETCPDAITMSDLEGRLITANEQAAQLYGCDSVEEFLSSVNSAFDFIAPEDRPRALENAKKTIEEGLVRNVEYRLVRKDGSTYPVELSASTILDAEGRPQAFVGVVRDISERKQVEEALRVSEEFSSSLLNSAPNGIIVINPDTSVQYVNRALEKLTGFAAEEIVGRKAPYPWWTDETHHKTAKDLKDAMSGGARRLEELFRKKNGEKFWVELFSVRVERNGEFKYYLANWVDITERKRAEQEKKRLQEQIQHAQKLESLGVLAGGIAHDFNNLLMGVLGNASLALLDLPEGSPMRHSLEQIDKTARAAADLTNQMLAYSGKGRFVVEAVDLSRLVEEMTGLLKVSISKKVDLKFDFDRDLPPVEADAAQLRQVIMNLIINASEAIGEKSGVVSVRTGTMKADSSFFAETYTRDDLPEGTYVYLEVSDTGCGMDQETTGKIFDPFFTTKFTGRGLGLAAVLGIVRGHQGAVRVQSEPGQGTTIRVVFPPCEREIQPTAPEPREDIARAASGKILVVDDEATIRDVSRRMLQSCGFDVITADNGLEAVELFRAQSSKIAAVLLDATMPQMDGLETFEKLRRIRKDIRVVLSSGYSEQEATERFTGKGLTGFIQKPYRFDDLVEKIHEVLGE